MINPITREVTQIELNIDGTVTYVGSEDWDKFLDEKLPYIVEIPKEGRLVFDTDSGKYTYDYVDIDDWITTNLKDIWYSNMRLFRFADANDALLFKMFWDNIPPDYSPHNPIRSR